MVSNVLGDEYQFFVPHEQLPMGVRKSVASRKKSIYWKSDGPHTRAPCFFQSCAAHTHRHGMADCVRNQLWLKLNRIELGEGKMLLSFITVATQISRASAANFAATTLASEGGCDREIMARIDLFLRGYEWEKYLWICQLLCWVLISRIKRLSLNKLNLFPWG